MIALAIFFKWFGLFLGILALAGLGVLALAWWNDRRAQRRANALIARLQRQHRPTAATFTRHRIQP